LPRSVPGYMVGMTGPPPTGESHVSVGKPEPEAGGCGKEMGRRPDGLLSPKTVLAMELPLSWPGSISKRMLMGPALLHGMWQAPGQRATTTRLTPAAASAETMASCHLGRKRSPRSPPSDESVATTMTTRSMPAAAATAAAASCVPSYVTFELPAAGGGEGVPVRLPLVRPGCEVRPLESGLR
jgi:hypothetical protein